MKKSQAKPKPTADEVKKEIKALEEIAEQLKSFRPGSKDSVAAQIKVMQDNLSVSDIEDFWADDDNPEIYDAAIETRKWLDGAGWWTPTEQYGPILKSLGLKD